MGVQVTMFTFNSPFISRFPTESQTQTIWAGLVTPLVECPAAALAELKEQRQKRETLSAAASVNKRRVENGDIYASDGKHYGMRNSIEWEDA